nr:MAG TPA: hypothetical protein [Caudoviricetes sp.]
MIENDFRLSTFDYRLSTMADRPSWPHLGADRRAVFAPKI